MRPAQSMINLHSLRHNYELVKTMSGRQALAVIKANAYGHGAVTCARTLDPIVDGFAVACIEEALELRAAGIKKPILLLEGWFDNCELALIQKLNLWTVIHHHGQLLDLDQTEIHTPLNVWLKLDTGMHRVGFTPEEFPVIWRSLQVSKKISKLTKMTHFSGADEPDCGQTEQQLAAFESATKNIIGPSSLCNSAGVLTWPQAHGDWLRPGIMLYGASPFDFPHDQANQLRPVMQLESRIIAVQRTPSNEPIGYGSRYVTERETRVGVVAMGYADGYPRHAKDGTPIIVDGQRTRLIGRISMDMLTLDLTDLPNSGLGSRVQLWGTDLSLNEVSSWADTIPYQLLCNLNRVPRHYIDCE